MGGYVSISGRTIAESSGLTDDSRTNVTGHGEQMCPTISWFQFVLNTVIVSLMCLLGLVGNTVSILVLQRDRHNRVAVFLLQALAIADNSVLCLVFVGLSVGYGLLPVADRAAHVTFQPYVVKYINPLGNVAQSCVIWVTVLLAVNRYVAVCRPYSADRWLTMKYARIQVAVVVAVSVLLNTPRVFLYGAIPSGIRVSGCSVTLDPEFNATALGTSKDFERVYLNGIYTSVVLVLPLVLLVGFNVPLMRQMQRSKRRMKQNSLSYSGRQENSITVVMVVIIVELIVCHAPDRIAMIVRSFYVVNGASKDSLRHPQPLFFAVNITNLLVILNSSTDFIIYYVFRRRFRQILCSRLSCVGGGGSPTPTQSEVANAAVCAYGNVGAVQNNLRPGGRRTSEAETKEMKTFSLKDRYRLSKKRDSNQILLLKLNNVT